MNASLIERAVELNDPVLAKEALREIDERLASSSDRNERGYLLFSRASCYRILGSFEEARSQLSVALQECPDDNGRATFDFMQGLIFQEEGNYNLAFEKFSFMLSAHHHQLKHPELRFMYEDIRQRQGFLLVTLKRFQEAIPVLTETLSFNLEEHAQEVHLYLGICHDQLGDSALAREEYLRAIAYDVRNEFEEDARYRAALVYFHVGAFAQAKHHLEAILEAKGPHSSILPKDYVYELLSRSCLGLGEEESAKTYAEFARKAKHKN